MGGRKMWLGGEGSREDFWKGLENLGPLEQWKENMAKFQVQRVSSNQTNWEILEKNRKEKVEKTSVSQTYAPLEISSSRIGCSGDKWIHSALGILLFPVFPRFPSQCT